MSNEQSLMLEAAVLKTERITIKLLAPVSSRKTYRDYWPVSAPPRTLIARWVVQRLGRLGVNPEDVLITLEDGKQVTGRWLIDEDSKLRMGDLRPGPDNRPGGASPTPIGELENRILESEGVMIIIRRPVTDTVPYIQSKPASPSKKVKEWIVQRFEPYGIVADEIVIISGHTMTPLTPGDYYTMGQLRATYRNRVR